MSYIHYTFPDAHQSYRLVSGHAPTYALLHMRVLFPFRTARSPSLLHAGDVKFCPLNGRTFSCTGVVTVSQENVDGGQLLGEVTVTSRPVTSDDVVGDSFSLSVSLDGNFAVVIGMLTGVFCCCNRHTQLTHA